MFIDILSAVGDLFSPFRALVFSLSISTFVYLIARRFAGHIKLGDFVFWVCLTLAFIVLSVFPASIILINEYVGLGGNDRFDRLILLSFAAVIILFVQNYRLQSVVRTTKMHTADSIQALYAEKFLERSKIVKGSRDVILLIPAYNEEGSIKNVLSRVPKNILGFDLTVLVIADGCKDHTVEQALSFDVNVLELSVNSGQAFAYRTGYKVAILGGFKYVLHLDADGQYNPEELHLLLNPLIKGEADLVSGSRLLGAYEEKFKNNNVIRSIGVYFFNFVLSIIIGKKVSDSASGFRGITVNVLSKLQLEQTQFHSSELLIEAVKKGAAYTEVGVSFNRRFAGISKKPSDFAYAVGFTKAIIRSWFKN